MDDDIHNIWRNLDAAVGAYAELYPTIARRLAEAARSPNPELRKRLRSLHEAREASIRRWCENLKAMWRLTPAEARLTLHLAEGGTVKGYAELSGVAESTVRTQLKAVFAKTGAKRQAALTVLVGRP